MKIIYSKYFDKYTLFYLFLSYLFLYLATHLPITIFVDAMHDDALFWRRAQDIVAGNWLGAKYDQYILAKGAGYSLFEAFNYYIGLPITFTLAFTYLLGCLLVTRTILKYTDLKIFVLILFSLLLFHPQVFPTRVIRDNLYICLPILTIFGFFRCVQLLDSNKFIIFFYGLFSGLFWITREEGVWIIPGIIILLLLSLINTNKKYTVLKNTVIYLCASITVIILISTINFFKYGKFLDEDFKSASFKDALTALYRVDDGIIEPYKPVSKIKRELVYNVSPSFAELKSYFEAGGLGWTKAGCDYKEYKYICDQQDYASGWFMWALRDAVASIGYYKSPMKADDFYLRVANEINNACNQGLINCRSQIMGIIPPTSKDQWANLLPTIYKGFEVLNFSYGMEIEIPSVGPIDKIKSINGFLGNPFVSPPLDTQEILVAGWINTTNREWPYIGCLSQDGKSYNKIELAHLPSQDLKDPNLLNNRFSIRIKEGIGRCYFYSNDGKQLLDINAHINKRGGYDLFPTFYLNLDEITKLNYDINNADPKFVNMKKLLVSFYSSFINYLCIIGFLSFVIIGIYSIFKSHKIDDLFILCFSLWISIFVRVFLLSLIEISSFKAIAHLYLGPAFPMIILASMLSIITLFNFFPYRGFLKISIHIKKKVNS